MSRRAGSAASDDSVASDDSAASENTKGALRVPLSPLVTGPMPLPEDAALYILRVHRLKRGDRFIAFDPDAALEADAELVDTAAPSLIARIGPIRPALVRSRRRVTLIQATAKGDKMDAIVRDATELGATRIVPAVAERSVSRPSGDASRAERWRRIAVQAARQSGRGDAPKVEPPMPFTAAIEKFATAHPSALASSIAICLDPRADVSLRARLLDLPADAEVVLIVGPEGGFSEAELAFCDSKAVHRVSMGPLVLRTETVCAAVLGALLVLSAPAPDEA